MAVTQIIQLTQKNWKIPSVIHAVQNDTGRELKMVIADEVYSSGTTAELAIRRSDVSFYSIETTFNASDNSFTADISQALTQAGITDCQLKVYVDNFIVSAYMFQIVVQESADGVPEEQLGYNVQDLMEAAEKIKGGGLTEEIKQALLNFVEKAAFSNEGYGQEVYDELYNAFYENTWAISATLSNASSSNPAESIEKGASYTTIISATTGYTLDGATVQVTMGGANVTSAVYSNGVINILSVTGDVVITVVAVALTIASISAVYTQEDTVYVENINELKENLVVTATFSDSSTVVIPSTDYTLTGSLIGEGSTITATFGEETTTFTVDGFTGYKYVPSTDGLLKDQPYITVNGDNYNDISESIVDGTLKLYCATFSNGQTKNKNWLFAHDTCTTAEYRMRIKVLSCGDNATGTYVRFTASNGDSGLANGFNVHATDTSVLRMAYYAGTTGTAVSTTFSRSAWHDVILRFDGSHQSITVDGVEVVSNAAAATGWANLSNRIRIDGAWYKATEVYISELTFTYT